QWVENQLKSINIQQADRDMKNAEFNQRIGHPGSAYFYYELVCRRYPNTKYAETAAQRKGELRVKVEKEQEKTQPPPQAPANPAAQPPATNAFGIPRILPSLMPPTKQ